jgi:hypothetical protein
MGRQVGFPDWERLSRGWGTAPVTNPFSGFQQNAPPNGNDSLEISEAAADMFLNWVYRALTDLTNLLVSTNPCATQQVAGDWLGFRNIDGNGNLDVSWPGNARYWWMDQQVVAIFQQQGW